MPQTITAWRRAPHDPQPRRACRTVIGSRRHARPPAPVHSPARRRAPPRGAGQNKGRACCTTRCRAATGCRTVCLPDGGRPTRACPASASLGGPLDPGDDCCPDAPTPDSPQRLDRQQRTPAHRPPSGPRSTRSDRASGAGGGDALAEALDPRHDDRDVPGGAAARPDGPGASDRPPSPREAIRIGRCGASGPLQGPAPSPPITPLRTRHRR